MPPLTPEQLQEIPVRLEKLTRAFEETVLEDISRRIVKAGTVTDTAEWQLIRLKEMGYANDFLEKAIAEYAEKSAEEISRLFFDAAQVSDEFYAEVYAKAGKPFTPLADNALGQQLIEAGIKQTENELKNFTRSMGFRMRDPDGTVSFKPAAKAYQDALDLAQMQVLTGVFDYGTAIRRTVSTLAESGLRFVDYETGHVNHADVAVRRAVLTGVSQMSGKISEQNAAELDTDLVEVTAHAGARPDHAEWQGRWYSLSGKSKKYPSLVEVTGYGTGAGLKGWNCRHDFYPVLEGISVPAYTEEELKNIDPPPIEYDGKTYTYYECTQRQRRIETAIRKTKRAIISAKASSDGEMFTAKSVLLRRQREEYEKFSSAAGLLTQKERTQVYGFDRSTAGKASWTARKKLDNSGRSDIINIGSDKVRISAIEQPIEQQHTGKGNPNAILTFDTPLNNRQQQLLEQLNEYDSKAVVSKKSVNMADLSALTAKTGDEFAMFTKGNERLIIRGNSKMVNIGIEDAEKFASDGYKWSGHTHPGIDRYCLQASAGDMDILKCFNQKISVIYNSKGNFQTFEKE